MAENHPTRKQFIGAGAAVAGAAVASSFGFSRLASAAEHENSITQIATLGINEEKADEAIAMLKELCAAVEEHEPGVLAYICHRSKNDTGKVVFFEVYKDEAALTAHGSTPHIGKLRGAFGEGILKPPVDIQPLERLGGFYRS